MTVLALLESAYARIPEPDDETVAAARQVLLAEIAAGRRAPVGRRGRRVLRLSFAVAVGSGAVLAGVLTLVVPRGHGLTGEEIAAAAYRVLAPPPNAIRHVVITTETRWGGGWRSEEWVASGRPYATHEKTAGVETELSQCGRITYDRAANLVTVHKEPRNPAWFFTHDRSDPAREFLYLSSRRFGPARYDGKTTFRGIRAYKLVRRDRADQGARVVYLVRRDNYYPLRIVVHIKGQPSFVYTFSAFDEIPRTAETEQLLHIRPHPKAFLLRVSATNFYRVRECAGFGTFESLTGKAAG
jgi:hypothetical protein